MVVGILKVKLQIPESNSLKAKRAVLKGIKERLRNNFNVSVMEAQYHDKWQVTLLAVACIGGHSGLVNGILSKVVEYVSRTKDAVFLDYEMEML